jgi:uncharacterized protein (TIGR02147 family)
VSINPHVLNTAESSASETPYQQINLDTYAVISDWYHYAILELTRVKSFEPNLNYITRTLGIGKTEAHIAVDRLQRLGLLKVVKNKWIDASENGLATNINADLTSEASRNLQRQILEKAITALDTLPPKIRNQTSITMAIAPEDLPEAKERIKKFRHDLCQFFERNGKPTQVYQLGISLYPLTRMENL